MSDQEPNEGVGSLFFELAGDLRLLMLTKLNQKNYRLSQLATELNATMQEAHRNMTRLIEAGLVAKGRDGELMLTVYGRTVVVLMPSYDFSLTTVLATCRLSLSRGWGHFRAVK
jgi:predicted transcriptional regulator